MSNELVRVKDQDSFLQRLIDSKKLPAHVSTVQEAFTVLQMGKELGFQPMQSFHYIIPIQGKLTLSAKAQSAILRRNGIEFKTIEDGVYVYSDGISEFKRPEKDGKPLDRRTTIEFKRDTTIERTSYSMIDANTAGLTSKDNWTRMPKEMLYARCFSKGANRIAADYLLGLYGTDEMFDALSPKASVKRDEDGTITEIIEDVEHELVNEKE